MFNCNFIVNKQTTLACESRSSCSSTDDDEMKSKLLLIVLELLQLHKYIGLIILVASIVCEDSAGFCFDYCLT